MQVVTRKMHNGKFEAELDINMDELSEVLKGLLEMDSLIVHVSITTMHHESRGKAKSALKHAVNALCVKLNEVTE